MKDATNHADGRGYRRGTRLRRAGSAHVLREEAYMFFLTYLRHELRRRMR